MFFSKGEKCTKFSGWLIYMHPMNYLAQIFLLERLPVQDNLYLESLHSIPLNVIII